MFHRTFFGENSLRVVLDFKAKRTFSPWKMKRHRRVLLFFLFPHPGYGPEVSWGLPMLPSPFRARCAGRRAVARQAIMTRMEGKGLRVSSKLDLVWLVRAGECETGTRPFGLSKLTDFEAMFKAHDEERERMCAFRMGKCCRMPDA